MNYPGVRSADRARRATRDCGFSFLRSFLAGLGDRERADFDEIETGIQLRNARRAAVLGEDAEALRFAVAPLLFAVRRKGLAVRARAEGVLVVVLVQLQPDV